MNFQFQNLKLIVGAIISRFNAEASNYNSRYSKDRIINSIAETIPRKFSAPIPTPPMINPSVFL